MTENKKYALRCIIESGIYITGICCDLHEFKIYSPRSWLKYYRLLKSAGLFARWLQKLAFYSSINFEGFDEDILWQEYELLNKKLPSNAFIIVRQFYEQNLQRVGEKPS
jgi:hypothetical protein